MNLTSEVYSAMQLAFDHDIVNMLTTKLENIFGSESFVLPMPEPAKKVKSKYTKTNIV